MQNGWTHTQLYIPLSFRTRLTCVLNVVTVVSAFCSGSWSRTNYLDGYEP
jgi:hypothetical protein